MRILTYRTIKTMIFRNKTLPLLLLVSWTEWVRPVGCNTEHNQAPTHTASSTLPPECACKDTNYLSTPFSICDCWKSSSSLFPPPNHENMTKGIHTTTEMSNESRTATNSGIIFPKTTTNKDMDTVTESQISSESSEQYTLASLCPTRRNTSFGDNCESTSNKSTFLKCKDHPFISEKQYENMQHISNKFISPTISIVGLLGNVIGIITLIYHKIRQTFHLCLLCLMVIDSIYLVSTLLVNIISIVEQYHFILANYMYAHMNPYVAPVRSMSFGTGANMVGVMACERFVAIIFPFWSKRFRIKKYVMILIGIILVINVSLMIIRFFNEVPRPHFDVERNVTMFEVVDTEFKKSNVKPLRITLVFVIVVFRLIPLIITVMANISILVHISKQNKKRAELFPTSKSKTEQREQIKRTIAMSVYSLLTVFAMTFSLTTTVLRQFRPEQFGTDGCQPHVSPFFWELGNMLRTLNSSLDFVIYLALSKAYRKTMRTLFLKSHSHPLISAHPPSSLSQQAQSSYSDSISNISNNLLNISGVCIDCIDNGNEIFHTDGSIPLPRETSKCNSARL